MIVSQECLSKLKQFGLNSYESKLWASLLSRGVSTAGELSDIANVPRSRSYDVLESLERKGFILSKLGKPIKYIAVPPHEVIERVKIKINEQTKAQEKTLAEIKTTKLLTDLNGLFAQGQESVEPHDMNANIKGRDNLYHHMEMSIKNAQKSITLMTTEQGLGRKAKHIRKALEAANKKGVKIRIASPATNKELKKIADMKQVAISSRFMIKDGKEVLMMITDDESVHPSYDVGIWVNSPFFAQTMQNMFNQTWQK